MVFNTKQQYQHLYALAQNSILIYLIHCVHAKRAPVKTLENEFSDL